MCSVDECTGKIYALGYCRLHYGRFNRTGSTDDPARTPEQRFEAKVDRSGDCHLWIGSKNSDGYGNFYLDDKLEKAHRYAYRLANGDFDESLFVCHACDNPSCVNPDHLFLGDQTRNMQDMISKGRQNSTAGSKNGRAKLDEDDVRQVRKIHKSGKMSTRELAHEFGMGQTAIAEIVANKTWRHVT
jgi:hypothetical protein